MVIVAVWCKPSFNNEDSNEDGALDKRELFKELLEEAFEQRRSYSFSIILH